MTKMYGHLILTLSGYKNGVLLFMFTMIYFPNSSTTFLYQSGATARVSSAAPWWRTNLSLGHKWPLLYQYLPFVCVPVLYRQRPVHKYQARLKGFTRRLICFGDRLRLIFSLAACIVHQSIFLQTFTTQFLCIQMLDGTVKCFH